MPVSLDMGLVSLPAFSPSPMPLLPLAESSSAFPEASVKAACLTSYSLPLVGNLRLCCRRWWGAVEVGREEILVVTDLTRRGIEGEGSK